MRGFLPGCITFTRFYARLFRPRFTRVDLCFPLHCSTHNRLAIMDCRVLLLMCLVTLLSFIATGVEGRTKKVVIHVPFKVKKIKHTHTVYKTVHHHHIDHGPLEEHEHFHHMHVHEEPSSGQHSQPIPGIGIPEFLPDVPDVALEIPVLPPPDIPAMPPRHLLPIFRRKH